MGNLCGIVLDPYVDREQRQVSKVLRKTVTHLKPIAKLSNHARVQHRKSDRMKDLLLHVDNFSRRELFRRDEGVIGCVVLSVVFLGSLLELVRDLHASSADQLETRFGLWLFDRSHEQVEQVDAHVKSLGLQVEVLRNVNQPVD